MAGSLFKKSGMSGRQQRYQPMADINVTPFVDVMLVLLIVFMVTAPLMTVGVPVDLPKTKAAEINDSDEPLVITLNKDGVIFIQESKIELENLTARLMAIAGNNSDIRIFIRGDKNLEYGTVMQVMGQITSSGFKKVALLAKLPEQK